MRDLETVTSSVATIVINDVPSEGKIYTLLKVVSQGSNVASLRLLRLMGMDILYRKVDTKRKESRRQ